MTAWLILALRALASWIEGPTHDHHLATDPACVGYKPPRPGSRLDLASRGLSCSPCQFARAWGFDAAVDLS